MTSTHDALQQQLRAGGHIEHEYPDSAMLSEAAGSLGLKVFAVNCSRAKSKSAVLRAIATAVDFPEFFGGNLDALMDCLTTTVLDQKSGALILLCGLHDEEPGLTGHIPDILDTFADAAEDVRESQRVLAYARVAQPIEEDED